MKTYEIERSAVRRAGFFAMPGFLTIFLLIGLLEARRVNWLIILLIAGTAWLWWLGLTIAYKLVLHDDGTLEWIAVARRVRILPEDVRSIYPEGAGAAKRAFVLEHARGKLTFINEFTGSHEVIEHIKHRNPTVVIKGC